jgi:hypothetical protein
MQNLESASVAWNYLALAHYDEFECVTVKLQVVVQVDVSNPTTTAISRSQWPSGLRRGSAAARLLELRDRIPPTSCECCVLSGLSDRPITRLEECY